MYINDKIEYLHKVITGVKKGSVFEFGIFDRMFTLGVVSLFNNINQDLEELNKQLDISPNLEALSIKFDIFLDKKYWFDNLLFSNKYAIYEASGVKMSDISYTKEINCMTDYLPPVKEKGLTQEQVDSFKRALHQICDEDKFSYRNIQFGLIDGIATMLDLLTKIEKKVNKPANFQYIKIWNEIYEEFKDKNCLDEYNEWKEELDELTFNDLVIKQKQELYKFLNSDMLRFIRTPIGYALKKCSIIISEDELPVGTKIQSETKINAAKFDSFIEWKGKYILKIDYEKLGKYLYKNYHKFSKDDFYSIVDLDMVLNVIHEDMAEIKPILAPYIKSYEDNIINQLYNECEVILNTCQTHLAKGIKKGFLSCYLRTLLFSKEMRDEAIKKLSGGSRNKYICEIVAALKNVHAFLPNCDKKDLVKSLSKKMKNISEYSIGKNIERAYNANQGALLFWTRKNIDDIKIKSDNPFKGIV